MRKFYKEKIRFLTIILVVLIELVTFVSIICRFE